MQRRGRFAASRQDKVLERWQSLFVLVNPRLEALDVTLSDQPGPVLIGIRCGKFRTNGKQFALDLAQLIVNWLPGSRTASDADRGIEFIDRSIGFDTSMILGDARAAKQAGTAHVSGSCVDFHRMGLEVVGDPASRSPE